MTSKIIDWNNCKKEFIRKVEIYIEKINSIKNKALKRLERARKEKREIDFAVEDYYEVTKELLVAYLLKNGLRSKNHQCLISYFLKKNSELEREAQIIQQMSYFRNRLNYYGEDIPRDFYDDNKKDFEKIIKLLFALLKKENE